MSSDIKYLRLTVENYFDIQKLRIARGNALRAYGKNSGEIKKDQIYKLLLNTEKQAKLYIIDELKQYIIWEKWLKYIKGVGPVLAGGLISWIEDPRRFQKVSQLWSYCGYGIIHRCRKCKKRVLPTATEKARWTHKTIARLMNPPYNLPKEKAERKVDSWLCHCEEPEPIAMAPRKVKGEIMEWNPKLRRLLWNLRQSFARQGGFYRDLYRDFYIDEEAAHQKTCGCSSKKHIRERALRKTVKVFLHHLWLTWMELLGETPSKEVPYGVEKGYSTYIPPPNPAVFKYKV